MECQKAPNPQIPLYTNKYSFSFMQDEIFDALFKDDDVTWQSMIHDAVKSEQMDPWDIEISALAERFLAMIRQLKEMDFRISGKIILAAAILLRIKSHRLVSEDLGELDRLLAMSEETEDDFYDELEAGDYDERKKYPGPKDFRLTPKTPQPRKRKVSVYDLVEALQKALDVKKRRQGRERYVVEMEIPEKGVDISVLIDKVYAQVVQYYVDKKDGKMTFSSLLTSDTKDEKIHTFVPLLHLSNQGTVGLDQTQHLGEIDIQLLKKREEQEKEDSDDGDAEIGEEEVVGEVDNTNKVEENSEDN